MKHRSIPLCVLLSVLSLGIFFLYWFYRISLETVEELNYEKIDYPSLNLTYLILSLFTYLMWWNYKISAYLTTIEKNVKIETDFWSSPLSVLYGLVLHQSRINRVLATKAAAPRKRKPKDVSIKSTPNKAEE